MTSGSRPLCDLCGVRPATVRAAVSQNGRRQTLNLCDVDYQRLQQQSGRSSPFESLFRGGSLFDNFFGDSSLFDNQGGRPGNGVFDDLTPTSSRRNREDVNLADHMSEQTQRLITDAARKAGELGQRQVDTEHLLYALTGSDVVRAVLEQFRLNPDDLRTHIDQNAPNGTGETNEDLENIGVSPRVKSALERAFAASRELGHSYVGPEHLLIGLAEEGEGFAAHTLRQYGLTPQAVRQQVVKVIGRGAEDGRVERPTNTPNLDKYSRDLSALARQGKLDPVIGRAQEIETTIEVLARLKKNNPVLIGEPGVGKTAIVEGLAQRIVNGEVPDVLRDKRLIELSVNTLVAGSQYRGQFEERVQQLLDEVRAQQDSIILFIDEIHTIVGAGQGGGEGGPDIANTFKPALARGELNLIGATTLNESQKHIEKDAALERRFQPVFVPEPTVEQTITILRGLRDRFEAHHKVTIDDSAVVAAAELSDRYITGRFLPDKAIDLIDQAAARVRISSTSRPVAVQEMEAELHGLRRERDYATSRKRYDQAQDFEEQIKAREQELTGATDQWRQQVGAGNVDVRAEHIAQVVSKLTGIPVQELTAEERQRLLQLEQRLHERVVGQDQAVKAVSDAVRLARAGLRQGRRPIATFLFLGPTGVGKTELAKALAATVFGDEDAMVRIDMSEYMERHAVSRLVGAPPGYVGYEEGGQLTERVRRRPYSVVLLDEIEKAHPDVYNILLQVFDDGRLTDNKGRVVDFTNTIIIATSNLGSDLIQRDMELHGAAGTNERVRHDLMNVLRGHFRPEFINRIDEIIVFHALGRENIRSIVELQLELVKRTAHGQGITLVFDDSLLDYLGGAGYRPEFGARELRRLIRSELETRLATAMLGGEFTEGDTVLARYDTQARRVMFEKRTPAGDGGSQDNAENVDVQDDPAAVNAPGISADEGAGQRPDHQA